MAESPSKTGKEQEPSEKTATGQKRHKGGKGKRKGENIQPGYHLAIPDGCEILMRKNYKEHSCWTVAADVQKWDQDGTPTKGEYFLFDRTVTG